MGGEPAEGRGGGGISWEARLPVALLVALALCQLGLVVALGLSPWKGGGFGMFATLDNSNVRTLRVVAIEDGREVPVTLPADSERLRRAVRILPLHAWLGRIAGEAFRVDPRARAVRVEVWRLEFDHRDLHPTQHLLRRAVFRRPR